MSNPALLVINLPRLEACCFLELEYFKKNKLGIYIKQSANYPVSDPCAK